CERPVIRGGPFWKLAANMKHLLRDRRVADAPLSNPTEIVHYYRRADDLSRTLEIILACVSDACVTLDREWNFTYVNKKAVEMFRRPAGELLGRRLWDVFPDLVDTPFSHELEKALREKTSVRVEDYYAPFDMWRQTQAYPTQEGLALYIADITGQKKAEQKLQYQAMILDNVRDCIIVMDFNGVITHVNKAAQDNFSYAEAELIGQPISFLYPRVSGLSNGADLAAEWEGRRKNGQLFWADAKV